MSDVGYVFDVTLQPSYDRQLRNSNNDRRQILGRIYVQEIADGGLSLQTYDSVKAQI